MDELQWQQQTWLASGDVYYTEWLDRIATEATFAIDVVELTSSTTVDIDVEHKDRNELDSSASTASFTQISSTGSHTKEVSGLKQLWRLAVTVTGTGQKWATGELLAPTWQG